ncbi:GFA family protein [Bdellovibrio sp. SKB1291214]|uniref:GFA family protein n=1 Tax=Bdellovibrio sp. SKB1291214 TaxID=1732569 RepID=UPI000B515214|nr:GFA family protein [Bdellovibrio sp. SKB1291214]UYL10353.1 GFA family protein [Bdellovibrio sp. SKB1291214]
MSLKKYQGSCHCQKVRFSAELDFSQGTGRCNCSFCLKVRNWSIQSKPSAFKILAGEESLSDYSKSGVAHFKVGDPMAPYTNHHMFCKNCGVRLFSIGNIPEIGGDYVSISVTTLDDIDFKEVMQTPIKLMSGRDNDWFHVPQFTEHL